MDDGFGDAAQQHAGKSGATVAADHDAIDVVLSGVFDDGLRCATVHNHGRYVSVPAFRLLAHLREQLLGLSLHSVG